MTLLVEVVRVVPINNFWLNISSDRTISELSENPNATEMEQKLSVEVCRLMHAFTLFLPPLRMLDDNVLKSLRSDLEPLFASVGNLM